jgi:hypothetical protein
MAWEMTCKNEAAGIVEDKACLTDASRRNGNLPRRGAVMGLRPAFVSPLNRLVAEDELVVDGVAVPDDECHLFSRPEGHLGWAEAGVVDIDVDGAVSRGR